VSDLPGLQNGQPHCVLSREIGRESGIPGDSRSLRITENSGKMSHFSLRQNVSSCLSDLGKFGAILGFRCGSGNRGVLFHRAAFFARKIPKT
jgi:hypothetical protein